MNSTEVGNAVEYLDPALDEYEQELERNFFEAIAEYEANSMTLRWRRERRRRVHDAEVERVRELVREGVENESESDRPVAQVKEPRAQQDGKKKQNNLPEIAKVAGSKYENMNNMRVNSVSYVLAMSPAITCTICVFNCLYCSGTCGTLLCS
jgi:hypothetical protein